MSKIKLDKIEYQESNYVVGIDMPLENYSEYALGDDEDQTAKQDDFLEQVVQTKLDEAENKANGIISNAYDRANDIVANAQKEADEIIKNASLEKQKIIEEANQKSQEIIETAQESIEQERIEKAKEGYSEGHKDGFEKIHEELEEKIQSFDNFFNLQFEFKNKVLKSAKSEIAKVILAIVRRILQKEENPEVIDKIIKKTISLLEKKENVNIILSEKYARLILELQNKKLGEDEQLELADLRKYENFDIICNPKLAQDTIIVENLKERFDASLNSQLDVMVDEVFEACKKQDLNQFFEGEENVVE